MVLARRLTIFCNEHKKSVLRLLGDTTMPSHAQPVRRPKVAAQAEQKRLHPSGSLRFRHENLRVLLGESNPTRYCNIQSRPPATAIGPPTLSMTAMSQKPIRFPTTIRGRSNLTKIP